MKFVSPFGTLEYQKADMAAVNATLAEWLIENEKPQPPMVNQQRGATLTSKRMTVSFERFKRMYHSLNPQQKQEVDEVVFGSLPQVPDYKDEGYKSSLKAWNDERFTVKFSAMMESSIILPANEEGAKLSKTILAQVLTNAHEYVRLYRAIVDCSEITWEAINRYIVGMDRYYNGEPFLEVLAKRGKTERSNNGVDSWHVKAYDMFVRHSVAGAMINAPVPAQCQMAAQLFTMDYMSSWQYEDRPRKVNNRGLIRG